jgi:hypothetical protein
MDEIVAATTPDLILVTVAGKDLVAPAAALDSIEAATTID